jgi:hypothetical protein
LVITGLGSTTLEETLSRLDARQAPMERKTSFTPEKFEFKMPEFLPDEPMTEDVSVGSNDLDIPAFLRRGRKIDVRTLG